MLRLKNLKKNVPLAPLTTYKIGGPADYFIAPHSKDELAKAVVTARDQGIPYFILGTGANILFGDKGFRGLVIHNQCSTFHFQDTDLVADSGATIAELIHATTQKGLSGLEHFAGIPSSVGGAVWQNLHFLSPDRQSTMYIEQVIASARILDTSGEVSRVNTDYFEFGYDDSVLHHSEVVVLEVTFALTPQPIAEITRRINANLAWRNEKQPQLSEFPSCGSVFKKIEGVGAGRLIEQAGLKGKRVGGVEVSTKHTNYLINTGSATAADVRQLIAVIQDTVKKHSGYQLEPEITFVGEF